MSLFLDDGDVRLWHGDALDVLRGMESDSVDCVVCSPPYWSLRDYNVEGQLGLEETPELYVASLVEVFREVRRVLCPHGTCWVNLGDSYATTAPGSVVNPGAMSGKHVNEGAYRRGQTPPGLKPKDLVGIPWRVAFALQQDGWWLRSDIVWSKPNPMPESVTDRPTKSHEYVFLLTKQPRYYFDQEAVREPYQPSPEHAWRYQYGRYSAGGGKDRGAGDGAPDFLNQPEGYMPPARGPDGRRKTTVQAGDGSIQHRDGERWPNAGRNVRSVWTIATQPYPEAHFATYPEELVRRCVLAGCPACVCELCGPLGGKAFVGTKCGHSATRWRRGVVLDPFVGSGTTCLVARNHGRHSIGIDLNADYLALAATRLQQLSLLTTHQGEAHASQ